MPDNTNLVKSLKRKTISLNLPEEQIETLKTIKKITKIPLARIVEQLLDKPLKKTYKNLL